MNLGKKLNSLTEMLAWSLFAGHSDSNADKKQVFKTLLYHYCRKFKLLPNCI